MAPTVGPEHSGFEFLKGSFSGIKGYAMGLMTKSRRGKIYIEVYASNRGDAGKYKLKAAFSERVSEAVKVFDPTGALRQKPPQRRGHQRF